jgi:chemotaxis signal transduction protein
MATILPLSVDGAWLAIDAASVVEILGARPRAWIPDAPALAPAAVPYRGRAVAAIDLGVVLGRAPALAGRAPRRRTVIAEIAGSTVALPVDAAREVEEVEGAALSPTLGEVARFAPRAAALDGRLVPIVDLARVVEV